MKKLYVLLLAMLTGMLCVCSFTSCTKDDEVISVTLSNASDDTLYVSFVDAFGSILFERNTEWKRDVREFTKVAPGNKAVVCKDFDYTFACKVFVVKKNGGQNFLEDESLPMMFDYTHVFNYDELKTMGFCITIRDI